LRPVGILKVLACVAVVSVAPAAVSWGQDAETDRAEDLLNKGLAEYKAKEFQQSQATLLKVDRDALSDGQRKQLDDYLGRVRVAVKEQVAAMEDYEDARTFLRESKLAKAAALFKKVAANQFVADQVRKDAAEQAALVAQRVRAAEAAPATQPAAAEAPTTRPAATTKPSVHQVRVQELQARIDKAKSYIALGNQALDNLEIDEAISHFRKAVEIAPEYEPARIGLARAQNLTGMARGLSAISELEKRRRIQKQETEVRFAQAMLRSRGALQVAKSLEDFAKAREEANFAQSLITIHKRLFTDSEFRAKLDEVEQLRTYIGLQEKAWKQQRVQQQIREMQEREDLRRREAERQRAAKIAAYKERVEALRKQHKYAQAVEILERVLELDPEDTEAAVLYDTLSEFVLLMQEKEFAKISLQQETKQFVDIREAQIPWWRILQFPSNWAQIAADRQKYEVGMAAESPANRATRRKLQKVQPKLGFAGVPFEQVMKFMKELSMCSIHVRWNVLEQSGINRQTLVDLELMDVTLEKALRTILDEVGGITDLGYVIDEGVITVSTKQDLEGIRVTRVYDIQDLIINIPNYEAEDTGIGGTSNNVSGGNASSSGLWGNGGTNDGGGNENRLSREELIDNILDVIRSTIAPETWIERSGTIGSIQPLGGSIVVTQTPENHDALVSLLQQLRETRALQINVEARFIQVSTGFLNQVGVDLDFYLNLSTRLKPTGTTDPLTGAQIVDNSPAAHLPQWENRGFITNRTTPWAFRQGSSDFATPQQTQVPGSIAGTATSSALSIAGTFLDDIQVDFLLTATQANQKTRTLTAPRLTLYNNQQAYVEVATVQNYVAGVDPVVVANVAAYQPIIGTVLTGTRLTVTGTVSADRKWVTLDIHPYISSLNGFMEYQGALDADGNPIPGSGQVQLPNTTVQQVQCTVTVPDEGTLLLGGQRLAGEAEREMGVPVLAKIPVLNRAFSNRSFTRDEQTLLILVKPKIIIQQEAEAAAFPD